MFLGSVKFHVGDVVELKKTHPCGGTQWEITRTGMDFGLRCVRCGRRVLIPRAKFEKQVKKTVRLAVDSERPDQPELEKARLPGPSKVGLSRRGRAESGQPRRPGQSREPSRSRRPGQSREPGKAREPSKARRPGQSRQPGQSKGPGRAPGPRPARPRE